MPGCARNAASGMASRAAQIEARNRTAIIRVAQHWTGREELPQGERAVEYIATDEAECSFKVERGEDLARQHRVTDIRRIMIDRLDHEVGDSFAMLVP